MASIPLITLKEHKDECGLLYYYTPSHPKIYSDKILILDLDWTLIKPKSGKKQPVDSADWVFNMDLTQIAEYYKKGWKIVIMSNQKKYKPEDMIPKLTNILHQLGGFEIQSVDVLIAPKDDYYRKPSIGMWTYLSAHLNDNIPINYKQSFMVGDAAGRKGDFSAGD